MVPRVRGIAVALIFALVVAVTAFGRPVWADSGNSSPAADALFRAGREAFLRGDFEEAVSRFTESQRLDPAPGTLLNLALAEEKTNRLALAWEHARAAEAQLPSRDERTRMAQELFRRVDPRVPRLTLSQDATLPIDATVLLDGQEFRSASFDVALPADPGLHRVVVRARGHLDRSIDIQLAEGARVVERLEPGARALPQRTIAAIPPDTLRSSGPPRALGYLGIGAGAASLATGAIFGVLAIDRAKVSDTHCVGGCDDVGLDAQGSGRTFATISTVALISGAVFVAGGIVALLLSRDTP